jgi:hypothetical protein
MKVETNRRCFFLEGEAGSGLAEHNEWNVAVDAGAASALQARKRMKVIWGSG